MGVELKLDDGDRFFAHVSVRPLLATRIHDLQSQDPFLEKKRQDVQDGKSEDFCIVNDGSLLYKH